MTIFTTCDHCEEDIEVEVELDFDAFEYEDSCDVCNVPFSEMMRQRIERQAEDEATFNNVVGF